MRAGVVTARLSSCPRRRSWRVTWIVRWTVAVRTSGVALGAATAADGWDDGGDGNATAAAATPVRAVITPAAIAVGVLKVMRAGWREHAKRPGRPRESFGKAC